MSESIGDTAERVSESEVLSLRYLRDHPEVSDSLGIDLPPEDVPHPNRVTAKGLVWLVGGAITFVLGRETSTSIDDLVGVAGIANGLWHDAKDGQIARAHKALQTLAGKKLDPLVDKLSNASLQIIIALSLVFQTDPAFYAPLILIMLAGNANDVASTFQRYDGDTRVDKLKNIFSESIDAVRDPEGCEIATGDSGISTQANWGGKMKTIINCVTNVGMLVALTLDKTNPAGIGEYLDPNTMAGAATSSYATAFVCGVAGRLKRKNVSSEVL